jgi:putative transposase
MERFVCRLALAPSEAQKAELRARMRQARRWYNVVLHECVTRVSFIKANALYRDLCEARRASTPTERKVFDGPLRALQEQVPGLPGRSFSRWATIEKEVRSLRDTIAPRLGAQPANTIGERAFDTASKWLFGGDRPRYRRGHELVAVNGNQHITLKDGPKGRYLKWGELEVPVWYREGDERVAYALSHSIASIEVVYDGDTFAAHIICRGQPMGVPTRPGIIVGVDPGISAIAVVADDAAEKLELRVTSPGKRAHLRRMQRHAQRQADAAKRAQKRSRSLRKTRRDIARLQREEATTSKQATNVVAKAIVALGASIRLEGNSYSAFQAAFGRRMLSTRPGALALRLKQLADVTEVDSRLALSQMCVCGRRRKKPLSQRVHSCECGVVADRDLWSAFLARHVVDGVLDLGAAGAAYPSAQSRLRPRGRAPAAPSDDGASMGHASGAVAPLASEALADETPGNCSAKRDDGQRAAPRGRGRGQALAGDQATTRPRRRKPPGPRSTRAGAW